MRNLGVEQSEGGGWKGKGGKREGMVAARTGSLGSHVGGQLHDDAAGLLPANLNVKVHLGQCK